MQTVERQARRKARVAVEGLESRVVLTKSSWAPAPAVITGRIELEGAGRGLGGVMVQLLDADDRLVARAKTGPRGQYILRFRDRGDAPYVVHAAAPRAFVQTSPTFTTSPPDGSYATDPATGLPYTRASWTYRPGNDDPAAGPVGPEGWSRVAPAGLRPFQSPIDIAAPATDLGRYLTIHYASATPTRVENNGAEIKAEFSASTATSLDLDGVSHHLVQLHFHNPAENLVDGRAYPMEAHFVNQGEGGALSVVAVFLELGERNEALQPILDAATADLAAPGSSTTTGPIDLAGLLPESRDGWFFAGSLTAPPLSGALNWLVLKTPITLDAEQLRQYEAVAAGAGFLPNARPVQPRDGRVVNRFGVNVAYEGSPVRGVDFAFARRGVLAGPQPRFRPMTFTPDPMIRSRS